MVDEAMPDIGWTLRKPEMPAYAEGLIRTGQPTMHLMTTGGTIAHGRSALAHVDFRRLFAMRLMSQSADGLMQAVLVASLAFSPEEQTTAAGFALATAVTIIPYSLLGPIAGVFIDRWSRRAILVVAPVLRAGPVFLVLASPTRQAILFYAGALLVQATNRFYLATAQAIVPRLVPTEDLLGANSIATVGGTVSLLVGVFVGGLLAEATDPVVNIAVAAALWLLASATASWIRSDLRPHRLPDGSPQLRHELGQVMHELVDGVKHIAHTPRAVGPISSISLDQIGQGFILVLALVVFRERFGQGIGSFSWLIGAGAVGVFLGLLTVGRLDARFRREWIVGASFTIGGVVLIAVSQLVSQWSILFTSFVVGLTFAWKKIPVDTMVQESVPDGLRGRVFSVYDVAYNLSRLIAAALAIPLLPMLGVEGSVALTGLVFVLWTPVLPAWLRRAPEIRLLFAEGERAEEWPRSVAWGGVDEPVTVLRSALVERDGTRMRTFRLELADGSILDVTRVEPDGDWKIEREREG
jgi:MFS family permease